MAVAARAGGTHVSELNQAQFAEFGHARVRRFALQEQLAQGHLLAAEQRTHGGGGGLSDGGRLSPNAIRAAV